MKQPNVCTTVDKMGNKYRLSSLLVYIFLFLKPNLLSLESKTGKIFMLNIPVIYFQILGLHRKMLPNLGCAGKKLADRG